MKIVFVIHKRIYFCLVILLSLLISCEPNSTNENQDSGKKPFFLATTGMIADIIKNVAGDSARVESLMGAGVDPHLYKATRQDLSQLREADVIFYNGLYLEGKMAEVLEKLGQQKPVFAVSEGIPSQKIQRMGEAPDPHIWFDVQLWHAATAYIAQELSKKYPSQAGYFQKNAKVYQDSLMKLDEEVREDLLKIPKDRRVLITAHDAFGYFGKAYQVEVRGLQGISTISEFGVRDIKELVDFIVKQKIKAVFVESSISPKSLEAVVRACEQKGHKIRIGGTLYSDAMGADGTSEGTYIGMVRANVKTIVKALK
jgi:manganese/zinc/iron transport system substrate-binding protein